MSEQYPPYGPPQQPYGTPPPQGPPPGRSNTVLALVIAGVLLVIGAVGLGAALLLTGDDEPTTPSASSTPSESEEPEESEPPTEPTETTATTEPTETTATTEPTETPTTTEPTETPTTTQPPGQPFQLDPGGAYASPRNVIAAFLTALFEGDCGNVRAYATADYTFFARRCERNPDAFRGSTLDNLGEAIAIGQGFNVQADITLNGEPGVLVFETTDLDGNWLVSDLLSYE